MEIPKVITMDYLKKLDDGKIVGANGKKYLKRLTNDKVFKIFFQSNPDILKRFLISVLHLEITVEDCYLYFRDKELVSTGVSQKNNIVDFNIVINDRRMESIR